MIDTAMDKYASPFISAYRQNYMSGMFWFTCWKNGGNVNDFVVGGGFMDLSKVFDCIPMIL